MCSMSERFFQIQELYTLPMYAYVYVKIKL